MLYENTVTGAFGISFQAVRLANPTVSIPLNIAEVGKFKTYQLSTPPELKWNEKSVEISPLNGVQQWKVVALPPAEITDRTATQASLIRLQRQPLLDATDWTQLQDAQLDGSQLATWRLYRKELRDISKQAEFPWNVVWPVSPAA